MKPLNFSYATLLILVAASAFTQSRSLSEEINLFGSEQAAFNQAMKEVPFGWNEHETTRDPGDLQANVQWLEGSPQRPLLY
jgi:hypothetical protein